MSFIRKHAAASVSASSSKHSLISSSYQTTSTGIPSLDDILGGGLPLGMMLLILGTDAHTSYPDLIHRYFIAQGLASGHHVGVVGENAKEIVSNCMWTPSSGTTVEKDNEGEPPASGVKIAWRYENMKQFQTSVPYEGSIQSSPFELTTRIPDSVIEEAISSERLQYMHADDNLFKALESNLKNKPKHVSFEGQVERSHSNIFPSVVFRLSIPLLGSPDWGELSPSNLLRFLYRLRALLRQNLAMASRLCACISLPVHLSTEDFGGVGWIKKLALLSDGCIRLQSFAADPSLSAMFPGQHGLVHIENLPVPCSLVPPSDKFSELRGLSNYSSSDTGGSENNLAFKCTRKRFFIETLHLDVEGGVSERRTTVPITSEGTIPKPFNDASLASVPIVREEPPLAPSVDNAIKKKKKKVNFQTDRPDVYDF